MTTTTVRPQHMQALQLANHVRLTRARIRREIRGRQLDVRAVILEPPAEALDMTIGDLLQAIPRVGTLRMERMIKGICRSSLVLGHMSGYTRRLLCEAVDRTVD